MSVKVGLCLVALRPRPPFRAAARRWGQMQDMQGFAGPSHCSCTSSSFTDFVVWPQASHSPAPCSPRLAVWSAAREGQNSPSGRSRSRDRPMPSSWVVAIRTSAGCRLDFFLDFFVSRRPGKPNCPLLIRRLTGGVPCRMSRGKVSRTASRGPGPLFDVACRR
jgi:hypothetical protein